MFDSTGTTSSINKRKDGGFKNVSRVCSGSLDVVELCRKKVIKALHDQEKAITIGYGCRTDSSTSRADEP